jgi:hypothetical protein
MARFSIAHKRNKKKSIGGFHADYIDKPGKGLEKKSMGLGRTFGTAFSLILGGALCYVSLHYIPAFFNPKKIIGVTNATQSVSSVEAQKNNFILSAYVDAFSLKRTYLREGQSIQASYDLPLGMDIELSIRRCKPVVIVEVFKCDNVGEKIVLIQNDRTGTQQFKFQGKGFYMFDERIIRQSGDDEFRVIWSRA